MTIAVIRIGNRWRYESDFPADTPRSCTHFIHVPDRMTPTDFQGHQRYCFEPIHHDVIDRPLSARQLLGLAHLRVSSEIYVSTTII